VSVLKGVALYLCSMLIFGMTAVSAQAAADPRLEWVTPAVAAPRV
jgi:hypothetical protein